MGQLLDKQMNKERGNGNLKKKQISNDPASTKY